MVPRAGVRRVRRHARLHHHARAARVRRPGQTRQLGRAARHIPAAAQAVQHSLRPRHVRGLDPRRVPLRPVQRARLRHGRHRVHIRAGLLRVRVRGYVRELARGSIRLQEVRHPLRSHLRHRLPPHAIVQLDILTFKSSRVGGGVFAAVQLVRIVGHHGGGPAAFRSTVPRRALLHRDVLQRVQRGSRGGGW